MDILAMAALLWGSIGFIGAFFGTLAALAARGIVKKAIAYWKRKG